MQDLATKNITKIDIINAKNSIAFKDIQPSEVIPVKGVAIATDPEDGKQYGYLWSETDDCYAGNSSSIMEAIAMMAELIDADMKLDASVVTRTSKQGKEFLSLKISERQ